MVRHAAFLHAMSGTRSVERETRSVAPLVRRDDACLKKTPVGIEPTSTVLQTVA